MSIKHGMIWWNFGGIYVFSKAFYPSNDRCKTNRKRYMKLRSRNLATETAVALLCHHSFHSAQFSPSTSGGGAGAAARDTTALVRRNVARHRLP